MALAAVRPGRLRRRFGALDAVHYPLTIALPQARRSRPSVTVHDLQHLDHPELFSRAERLFRPRTHEGSARKADAVIVPSQFVRRRAIELLGLPPERVHAIPWGVDHERLPAGRRAARAVSALPGPSVAAQEPRPALRGVRAAARGAARARLVLTGGGHEGRPVPPGVEVLGLVSGEELASLYRRAACLVFPSLYEGFGQPPLEAMASGAPVAASNIPAVAEACGDAAALFDPTDPEDIAAVVSGVLDAPERFAAAGPERARGFTWAETARRHEAVYRSVGSARSSARDRTGAVVVTVRTGPSSASRCRSSRRYSSSLRTAALGDDGHPHRRQRRAAQHPPLRHAEPAEEPVQRGGEAASEYGNAIAVGNPEDDEPVRPGDAKELRHVPLDRRGVTADAAGRCSSRRSRTNRSRTASRLAAALTTELARGNACVEPRRLRDHSPPRCRPRPPARTARRARG